MSKEKKSLFDLIDMSIMTFKQKKLKFRKIRSRLTSFFKENKHKYKGKVTKLF